MWVIVVISRKGEPGDLPLLHFAVPAKERILENVKGVVVSAKFQDIKKKIAGRRKKQSAITAEKLDILGQTAQN